MALTYRALTLLVPRPGAAPYPWRDEVVAAMRADFPEAVIDTFVSEHNGGALHVYVSGPTAAQLVASARLYLGWLGIRHAVTRSPGATPISARLRAA